MSEYRLDVVRTTVWKNYENNISCSGQDEPRDLSNTLLHSSFTCLLDDEDPSRDPLFEKLSTESESRSIAKSQFLLLITLPDLMLQTFNVRYSGARTMSGSRRNMLPMQAATQTTRCSINFVQASLVGYPANMLLEYSSVRTSRGDDVLPFWVAARYRTCGAFSTIDTTSLLTRVARCEAVYSVPAAVIRTTIPRHTTNGP